MRACAESWAHAVAASPVADARRNVSIVCPGVLGAPLECSAVMVNPVTTPMTAKISTTDCLPAEGISHGHRQSCVQSLAGRLLEQPRAGTRTHRDRAVGNADIGRQQAQDVAAEAAAHDPRTDRAGSAQPVNRRLDRGRRDLVAITQARV